MHSRLAHEEVGLYLPDEWKNEISDLLGSIYESKISGTSQTFEVFGQTFPNEIVIYASLVDPEDKLAIPVTYVASTDLVKGQKQDKVLGSLVDSIGIFFDSYFATEDWNEYDTNWQEAEIQGIKFYYMISRENVGLTIMADLLLGKDS